jgi:RNA polymerase sigma factor (sigma-70 family)
MVWPLSDEMLVAGLGSGDPQAAAAFVRRFQSRVFGLAFTILGERGAAEEAAQEAFIRAWRHSSAYDPTRGKVSTWLLTITRNVSIDMVRVRRPEPQDPAVLIAMDHGSEEQGHGLAEDRRVLISALGSLPEEQRRALVLASLYGRTAQEISDIEGVPLGTIKTRIRTATHKLRMRLGVSDA